MLTQFLSALSKPRSLYFCFALVVILTGLTIIPLRPAKGKVNETKLLNSVPSAPSFASYSATAFSPPTISLTSPTNNASFIGGSTVTLSANALDSDGTVSKVEFFQGSVKLGEDTTSPYSYDWINVAAGDYVLTAKATDNAGEVTTSTGINISVLAQVKQYVGWSSITNGTDLGTGSVHKTSAGAWDFYANSLQTLVAGDGYFESTAANYNQSINLAGANGSARSIVIGSGGWVGIYENNLLVAATSSNPPVPIISAHASGDRYRIEITNSVLRYIRYRSASREVMFTSAAALPVYPISAGLGMSPQNAEWQKTVLAQLTRKATWASIVNGTDLGNGSVRKTSTGDWDFTANARQTLLRGDGYFESTASMYNQYISLGGSDGVGCALVVGSGGWAAIYENGQEVADTYPLQNIAAHAAGDRYRLEITNGTLRYVRYRSGIRSVMYTSATPLSAYPINFGLGSSPQNAEWQNTVFAQLSQTVSWSYITNGIDLGNGSVRKTSTGAWDFGAGPKQQLVSGSGYFESTASNYNHSISAGGTDGAGRALVVGTGGWAAIYENNQEVADTYPIQNITGHAAGDRYRMEIGRGKLRYVRYRAGVRSIMFTSVNLVPAYALGFGVGASFQNSEWQNTIFSDNIPEYNDASFISQTVATTMAPGQTYSVTVTMRNTGASSWTPDGDYQLGSENLSDNQRWGLSRVNLTTTVLPGSDATFNFTVTAPATGSHSFQWRMVQQGVERFGALTTNVNVQTVNGPPTVSLTSPANNATFTAPATVTLSANAFDSDGAISKVEFFQGSAKLGEATPPSAYTFTWTNVAAANYQLTARATDNGGATTISDVVSIRVNPPNQPPVAQPGGPYSGITGTAVQFNGGGSSDTDGYIASYQWTFGDTTSGTGAAPTHIYATAGTYQILLTVTDNNGAQASATPTATIANRAPVANAGGPYSGMTGTAIQFNGGSSSDPDGNIASYQWNFGDGTNGTGVTPTHTYAAAGSGPYQVSLTVTDNNGAQASAATTATVANRAPVANAGGPYNGLTGTAIQFNGGSSSDPDGTIASYQWNFGDGTSGTGVSPTHIYMTGGAPTVTLTVTDNNGATGSGTAVATITASTNVRLDPLNQTGGEGENPLSRNYNWSVGLLSLPGRAGLDLGLSLSYNSLVWTRNGSTISFDGDGGFPSPGFRLGFPVIQSRYFNSQFGRYAFMLITPNGDRVELRQIGASNIYQAEDSSYLTMTLNADNTITVRTTDGTQLSYDWKVSDSDYQCTKIKDRNGNLISINYVPNSGRIDTVVDTLNRTIKFNYDSGGFLISITQIWNQGMASEQTHNWASFSYNPALTIQTNFPGLTISGAQNNTTLKVLSSVNLNNNSSRFDFAYTSWGQVWKISNYAADGDLLNYRAYDLPGSDLQPTSAQSDCPRFTQRRDWAANWNGDVDGIPTSTEEAKTLFSQPINASLPDGSLPIVTMATVTASDEETYQQIYFAGTIEHTAGSAPAWQRGLPLLTETFGHTDANSLVIRQRSSASLWQDDLNGSYPVNPRVAETNIYDFNASSVIQNHKRTAVTYQHVSFTDGRTCNLTQEVLEYQANATTVLRRTHTDYNLSASYTDRGIIGLASEKRLYEVDPNTQTETLMSKVGFAYDENTIQSVEPVQHDNSSYSSSFVTRGNVTSVNRYDVSPGSGAFITSNLFYNSAGSSVKTIAPVDPAHPTNNQTLFTYDDQFSANGTTLDATRPATFAYPTSVTDPGGYSASSRYDYDFGGTTWRQTPQPNTTANLPGPQQTISYDSVGRIQRTTNLVNGAYTRYVYPGAQAGSLNRIDTYATIVDGASEQNGNEAHSFQIADGHGRVIASASSHPGSSGGFSGQRIVYDVMGRVFKTSNPTETHANGAPSQWDAAGDDQTVGWLYVQQTYDWKGRPLITKNPSITSNPNDTTTKEASYAGCGCAGGEVVTLTDEGTIDGGAAKRRQSRVYSDILGRTVKTELLNWQGGSPYATAINSYNGRDQVKSVRQYQGDEASGIYQETTMTYDGYGRLKTKHIPQQDPGTVTTWDYNLDDTVQKITDARGSVANYGYNARRLLTGITYDPSAGITDTPDVSFGYDAVGDRMSMTDGLGSKSYNYNQLSQLTSETRTFTNVGTFTLSYDYNLAGELKKITDSTGMTINYGYDTAGRQSSVIGSDNLYAGVSNYASNFKYRAWGGLKEMTDGKGRTSSLVYNSRLQPTHFEISGNTVSQDYDYYDDGRMKIVHNMTDQNFDRSYSYDHVGRMTEAKSGGEANGYQYALTPYHETFGYDAFSNLTARQSDSWNGQTSDTDSAIYTNSRRAGWGYDADGRNTAIGTRSITFDVTGQRTLTTLDKVLANGNRVSVSQTSGYDGDGAKVYEGTSGVTTYYLRSTALGGEIIEELNSTGQKNVGYVALPGGQLLATQTGYSDQVVIWKHNTPGGTSEYTVNSYNGVTSRVEFDPLGADISLTEPPQPPPGENEGEIGAGHFGSIMDQRWTDFFNLSSGFTVGGFSISSSEAAFYLNFGTGQSSINNVGVNPRDVANALGAVFAGVGASSGNIRVSGVEGTPGHQTIENAWTYAEGYGWYYGPTATAYSGVTATVGSVVSLASNISLRAVQPQNPAPEQRAADRAGQMLAQARCGDFVRSLLLKAEQLAVPTFGGPVRTDFSAPADFSGRPVANYPPPDYSLNLYRTALAQGNVTRATTQQGDANTIGATNSVTLAVQWNPAFYGLSLNEQAQHTIHESLHQEPTFDDYTLARAAGLVANGREPGRNDLRSVSSSSQYLNSILFQYCH